MPFPLIACVVPVIAAGLLWTLTGSVFVLAFAVLGPLVALGALVDNRRVARRKRKTGGAVYSAGLDDCWEKIRAAHAHERQRLWRSFPGPAAILSGDAERARWRHRTVPAIAVVIGSGRRESSLRVEGVPSDDDAHVIADAAGALNDAPMTVNLGGGIGILGPTPIARATARAMLVQVLHQSIPGTVTVAHPDVGWEWLSMLGNEDGSAVIKVIENDEETATPRRAVTPSPIRDETTPSRDGGYIAIADSVERLPPGCATVVQLLSTTRGYFLRDADVDTVDDFVPMFLGERECGSWLTEEIRRRDRYLGDATQQETSFDPDIQPHTSGRLSLAAVVGSSGADSLGIDLVSDGPHALVVGTTGSGKSEFLVTWIAAMAARRPPSEVSFLLVDFKGGAAFNPLRALPHITGVVTDLDENTTTRALESLRAELRLRERVLAEAGVSNITELPEDVSLARLIIVVDEYAVLVSQFPELQASFIDLASRGRSLGIHLILCTQRSLGAVAEAILANCAVRIALRVTSRSESVLALGTSDAAHIDPANAGCGFIWRGTDPVNFRAARASQSSLNDLAAKHTGVRSIRKPWLDPLPETITRGDLATMFPDIADSVPEPDSALIGMCDDPARQRYQLASWRPHVDGNLLVLGAAHSGRSSVLNTIIEQWESHSRVVRVAGSSSAVWDVLHGYGTENDPSISDSHSAVNHPIANYPTADYPAAGYAIAEKRAPNVLLVIDDIDALLVDCDPDYRREALDRLSVIMRSQSGVAVAASASAFPAIPGTIRDLFPARLHLHHSSKQELVIAGGDQEFWRDTEPPGAGSWRGLRFQAFLPERAAGCARFAGTPTPIFVPRDGTLTGLVTWSPRRDCSEWVEKFGADAVLLQHSPDPRIDQYATDTAPGKPRLIVGDPESWAVHWMLTARLRERVTFVFSGCSPADYRALTRARELPPLLDRGAGQLWVLEPSGEVNRRLLSSAESAGISGPDY